LEHVFSPPAVLTEPLPERRRRRPLSPRQEYEEFILQRIEDYKNQLSREQILALGDEAVRELEVGPEGQLLLTEVLMLEHVDRLITRRLRLPTFRRWRERHTRMRRAQRELTHWGLPADLPLATLAQRLEDDEAAVVIGAAAAGTAFFLAAHDVMTLIIAESLPGVEAIETRAAQEALAGRLQALVVALGDWFPDGAHGASRRPPRPAGRPTSRRAVARARGPARALRGLAGRARAPRLWPLVSRDQALTPSTTGLRHQPA
jgi:hypothetical protein